MGLYNKTNKTENSLPISFDVLVAHEIETSSWWSQFS